MIWILFYYNSLPDVPNGCKFFPDNLINRDFLICNPTNTGHFEYPKFETLSYDSGCHTTEVKNFLKRIDPDKYVVFYTRHTELSGKWSNKVIGYFRVGETFNNDKVGFYSSESVLLPKENCIEIPYYSRGVPVSWGYSTIKSNIDGILKQLISEQKQDISKEYKNNTLEVMKLLQTKSGQDEIVTHCEKCQFKSKCYWGKFTKEKKITRLNELYGTTTKHC